MKNILYIGKYNGIVGGIERYMEKSAALLRRSGFTVSCLWTCDGGRAQERFAGNFDRIGKVSQGKDLLETADLIILHNIIGTEYLKTLPAEKTFFFAHDHNIYCQRHHYYTPVGRKNCHRSYGKWVCQLCSLGRNEAPPLEVYRRFPALVLSDFMKNNLLKNGFEKVIKLPAFIRPAEAPHVFMPGGVLRILFLGQLIRGKGADLMLKVLSELKIPFECTIAGEGNDRAMLEKLSFSYGLSDKVRFKGFVSDPELLWQDCDLFFFPIRWQEPFGLVGLEAMAHGIPVAAFDLGGVREWLSHGENGFAIPEKDIRAAAGVLAALAQDPRQLESMGERGRVLAQEKFSEERFIERFNALSEVLK